MVDLPEPAAPPLTWLSEIVAWCGGIGEVINGRLRSVGLPELQHWYAWEPSDRPEVDFPFGWWDWIEPEDVGLSMQTLDGMDFTVSVLLVMAFGAGSTEELMAQIGATVPQAIAAVEAASETWGYTLRARRVLPGPAAGRELTRFVGIVCEVRGCRDWGEVL